MSPRRSGVLVSVVAAGVRLGAWFLTPPVHASDSAGYIETARAVCSGHFGALLAFPFHALYALLLTPAFWSGDHLNVYIAVLNITLSTATVTCIWAVTRQLTRDPVAPLIAAGCAAVYPNLLFWLPYILTETPFVFLLLFAIWALFRFLDDVSFARLVPVVVSSALLFFLRPVALLLVAFEVILVAGAWFQRYAPAIARRATTAVMILVVTAGALPWAIPSSRHRLVRIPTIAQTLWLSTRVVFGTQAEITSAATPDVARDWPYSEQYAYKARLAGDFIAAHPAKYVWMAARRFVAFWAPWRYLAWSPRHRGLDALLSLALLSGALAAVLFGATPSRWGVLLAAALLLSVESAFGQIDADARYRLPAEVLLIAPASVTASTAIRRRAAAAGGEVRV